MNYFRQVKLPKGEGEKRRIECSMIVGGLDAGNEITVDIQTHTYYSQDTVPSTTQTRLKLIPRSTINILDDGELVWIYDIGDKLPEDNADLEWTAAGGGESMMIGGKLVE